MSIYAGYQNEKSREALIYGNFAALASSPQEAEQMIIKCIQALKDNEMAFADAVIQEYEMNFDRINDVLIRVYNRGMAHEENYTPMKRLEVNSHGDINTPEVGDSLIEGGYETQAGGGSRQSTLGHVDRGFAQSRKENLKASDQKAIDLGLYNIWNNQMDAQEHAAAFTEPVRILRKVLTGKTKNMKMSIQQAVKRVHGKAAWSFIRNYFNITAQNQNLLAHGVLDGISGWLAKNMSTAYLCVNLGTALKQFSSFWRVLPYCGPKNLLIAIGQEIAQGKKFWEECYKLDPQLKNRGANVVLQSMRSQAELGAYGRLLDMGMRPIEFVDKFASIASWRAVYDYNIQNGRSQEEAVRAAQRAVALTQPTIHVKDAPLLWQQGGLVKLAMIFSNDMAQRFGISLYDLSASIKRGDIPAALWTVAGVTLGALTIGLISKGGPDDWGDPESWAEFAASSIGRDAVESIPLLGKGLLNLWDSKGYATGEQGAYLAPFARVISGANKLLDGKSINNEQGVFNLIEAGALLAPFPATAVRRLYRSGRDVIEGEYLDAIQNAIGMRRDAKKLRRSVGF